MNSQHGVYHPGILADEVSRPGKRERRKILTVGCHAYNQISAHHPETLHDATTCIISFLGGFDTIIWCTRAIRSLQRAAKNVQRRIRTRQLRKEKWKEDLTELWKKYEKQQQRELQVKIRQATLFEAKERVRHLKQVESQIICKDAQRVIILQDYSVHLAHIFLTNVAAWEQQYGERCKDLTMAYKGCMSVIKKQRAEIIDSQRNKKSKWKKSMWQHAASKAQHMQRHMEAFTQQQMDIICNLLALPSRPIFNWPVTQQDINWLVSRRKRQLRTKVEAIRMLTKVKAECQFGSHFGEAIPLVNPTYNNPLPSSRTPSPTDDSDPISAMYRKKIKTVIKAAARARNVFAIPKRSHAPPKIVSSTPTLLLKPPVGPTWVFTDPQLESQLSSLVKFVPEKPSAPIRGPWVPETGPCVHKSLVDASVPIKRNPRNHSDWYSRSWKS